MVLVSLINRFGTQICCTHISVKRHLPLIKREEIRMRTKEVGARTNTKKRGVNLSITKVLDTDQIYI